MAKISIELEEHELIYLEREHDELPNLPAYLLLLSCWVWPETDEYLRICFLNIFKVLRPYPSISKPGVPDVVPAYLEICMTMT